MKIVYLFTFLIFFSCNTESENIIVLDNFPKEVNLKKVDELSFDETIGTIALFSTKDYFIVEKTKSESFFDVYSKKDSLKIIELCTRGQGPTDFIAPFYSGQFKDNEFLVYDRAKSVIYTIDIDKSIKEKKTFTKNSFNFKPHIEYQAREMFAIDSNSYLYSIDVDECPFYVLDKLNGTNEKLDKVTSLKLPYLKHELSQKLTTYKNGKFASAYFSFPIIDFSSIDESLSKSISYKEEIKIDKNNLEKNIDENYFDAIDSTDDYILCLYNPPNSSTSDLLMLDWEGKPICLYHLPDYYIHFSIDQTKNNIYALTEDEIVNIFNL